MYKIKSVKKRKIFKESYLNCLKKRNLINLKNLGDNKSKIKSRNFIIKHKKNLTQTFDIKNNKRKEIIINKIENNTKNEIMLDSIFKENDLNNLKFLNSNLYEEIKYQIIKNRKKMIYNLLKDFWKKIYRIKNYLKYSLLNYKFPSVAFQNKKFKFLIENIKNNRYKSSMITFDLLHNYDYIKQTAVHYAVNAENIKVLIDWVENGADYDSQDIMGRTPIIIAILKENIEIVNYLLFKGSSPWINDKHIYYICNKIYKSNNNLNKIMQTAKSFSIQIKFSNKKYNKEEFYFYFRQKFLTNKIRKILSNYN